MSRTALTTQTLSGSPDDIRRAGPQALSLALMDGRNHTLRLLAYFGGATVPRLQETQPPAWVAGHIGWFGEYWIGRNPQRSLGRACPADTTRLASIEPNADAWFHPALADADARWLLDLPPLEGVRAFLLETLESTLELLEKTPADDESLHFFRAALLHEDLRREQLCTIAQTAGIALPVELPMGMQARDALLVPATRWMLGAADGGFAQGIERCAHEVQVPQFEIDAQAVNWSQYMEFVDAGGYDREELWHGEGWRWLQAQAAAQGRRGPRHVEQIGTAGGAVRQTLFGKPTRMSGSQCAMHVSWWEADAYARWAGRRLPTEAEWEIAAHVAQRQGFRWGEVLEWTAGTLRRCPVTRRMRGPRTPISTLRQCLARRACSAALRSPRRAGWSTRSCGASRSRIETTRSSACGPARIDPRVNGSTAVRWHAAHPSLTGPRPSGGRIDPSPPRREGAPP